MININIIIIITILGDLLNMQIFPSTCTGNKQWLPLYEPPMQDKNDWQKPKILGGDFLG